ncbi:two-component histidine kinase Le.nik1 protein [Salix suchowensis]|nr:two-component histidine kinase Le.nik1 protein [Salix suchowensis]
MVSRQQHQFPCHYSATAQDLASALISALESNTVSPVSAPNDVVFDILLAEDNLVNQKLAVKILEKYGHNVEIAENGSLAVDAFKSRVTQNRPFDIILVSSCLLVIRALLIHCVDGCFDALHGGMEATELIRSYEMHTGLSPTPIIALTAHATHACLCLKIVPTTGVATTALPSSSTSILSPKSTNFLSTRTTISLPLDYVVLKDLVAKLPDGFERARAQAIGALLVCSRGEV